MPGPGPTNSPKSVKNNLRGQDLKVFELHMRGLKNLEIAELLQIVPQTVGNILAKPDLIAAREEVFRNSISRLSSGAAVESAITLARAHAPAMMRLQIQIAQTAKNDATKLKAINDILDRSLGKPTQRVVVDQMDSILDNMNDEELTAFHKDGTLPDWAANDSGSDTVH